MSALTKEVFLQERSGARTIFVKTLELPSNY